MTATQPKQSIPPSEYEKGKYCTFFFLYPVDFPSIALFKAQTCFYFRELVIARGKTRLYKYNKMLGTDPVDKSVPTTRTKARSL